MLEIEATCAASDVNTRYPNPFATGTEQQLTAAVAAFSQALSGRKLEMAKEISFLASNANRTLHRPLYIRRLGILHQIA